jgi:hypothetical protein
MAKDRKSSQLHQLSLESLAKMDGGKVGAAFELALKRALLDCEDRPGVTKARVITLQVGVIPLAAADDDICDTVRFQCVVTDSVPKRQTRPYSAQLRAGGMAAFNDESLDDVNQMSLGLDDGE